MTSARLGPELSALRRSAEDLANTRRERLSSVHVLASIAARPSAAADLLHERRMHADVLLRAAQTLESEADGAVGRAFERACAVAARMGVSEPSGAHLLIALINEPRGAARRVLTQCGADVSRLRTAAMNLGLGLIGRRRRTGRREAAPEPLRASESTRRKSSTAVSVPLFPPAPVRRSPAPPRTGARAPDMQPAAALAASESSVPEARAASSRIAVLPAASAQAFALDAQKFPALSSLGRNLNVAFARGELDPIVGRAREIEQTLDVLAKRGGNSPCLLGLSGVGKTSVVHGLAQRIVENWCQRRAGNAGKPADERIVVEIPVGELLAGTGVRGALAARVSAIRKEVSASGGRVVLFFDEIHQLFADDASQELGSELKLALSRGELPCIGATTREEYAKAIEIDPPLARRFSVIDVDEPTREDAYLILSGLAPRLEAHHAVRYSEEALALTIAWSIRYLPGRALPDKAVSIVDLAGARARRRGQSQVSPENVAEIVAEWASMPVERLLASDAERMLHLEDALAERVVGHQEAVGKIARILRRNAAGLGSERPIGTFLLLGPTGVGKTETAKAVAEVLFHTDMALTRYDFSEFSEAHSLARLIGAPPGYVGYEAGGQLTEAVRKRPYQVLLLDEIEKAHPDVLTAFLAVFDEGRLTDGRGRTVDFRNCVIFMTSNIGADETKSVQRRKVGFGGGESADAAELERAVTAAARRALAPELYNRIDEVLVFSPLARNEVREIARRLLSGVARDLLRQRGVRLEVDADALEHFLDAGGFDPSLGARPMRRTLARLLEAPLAEKILRGELSEGDVVLVGVESGSLAFDVLERGSALAAAALA
ncbi:MAG TPA: ATP-dependent Clp protease ATP-binding subunit [Polyangiaceae bacterium]